MAPQSDDTGQGNGAQDQDGKDAEPQGKRRSPLLKFALIGFILVVLIGGGLYWWLTRFDVTTDDAYTEGRVVKIAPHVGGYVIALNVNDNQFVHQGQVLAQIDPRDWQAALDQAIAQEQQAEKSALGAHYASEVAEKNFPARLAQAKATLAQAEAKELNAQQEYDRQHRIAHAATTQQAIDQSTASLRQAQADVEQAKAQVLQASPVQANIQQTDATAQQQDAAVANAKAAVERARLNLEWTTIRAPHDGWIAQRNIERGNLVQSGQALFAIVQPDVWVVANFKETQLAHMRPGQPVNISVDAYPDLKLHGVVNSIQNGTGAQFSTFPPENATGNFVKIVQRVPVKIIIDGGLDPQRPLPLGLSVEPTVNVE
ncbi:membrane fusion protein (multidrug efflux system) [Endobacter medicaginis]|jgi:membrane fusion protein, multidrug efflux system|uniref:HlyD family secretion protein n=1 Tax=Endobacter medicaginis TaxID=1181271 RepID=A0A850NSS7_9PROT|nr:HlyD family secretion protein [Endobacter medicaginis]MBB3174960.1 membrane fusion protein (multidrug efflux system) [Endobacter medicaginis]MCX5477095.1 HlyD family secretion protein [Endobacter medicaginis]NVN30452.1 HlyD family secretion protein [Endobacter medicaginis]